MPLQSVLKRSWNFILPTYCLGCRESAETAHKLSGTLLRGKTPSACILGSTGCPISLDNEVYNVIILNVGLAYQTGGRGGQRLPAV